MLVRGLFVASLVPVLRTVVHVTRLQGHAAVDYRHSATPNDETPAVAGRGPMIMAERVGFEPTRPRRSTRFPGARTRPGYATSPGGPSSSAGRAKVYHAATPVP